MSDWSDWHLSSTASCVIGYARCKNASVSGSANADLNIAADALNDLITLV